MSFSLHVLSWVVVDSADVDVLFSNFLQTVLLFGFLLCCFCYYFIPCFISLYFLLPRLQNFLNSFSFLYFIRCFLFYLSSLFIRIFLVFIYKKKTESNTKGRSEYVCSCVWFCKQFASATPQVILSSWSQVLVWMLV